MSIEDDTHDKLTKAYLEYFKANEKFERFKGERTMQESRKWLREIRNHAKQRADEILTTFKNQKQDKKK
jgi:hypothetical protein